jgi:ABC-type multidrug transport system ATPase subunit
LDKSSLSACNLSIILGGTKILRDINFEISTGYWVSIIGANAAGKSTLLRSLVGWHKPSNGSVAWKSDDPFRSCNLDVLLVPQPDDLPKWLTGKQILEICCNGRSRQLPTNWPEVLEVLDGSAWLEKPVYAQSLGTRKKLCIASALCSSPALLLLDEAFDGLDINSSARVRTYLKAQVKCGALGILSASHAWESVFVDSDEVLFLSNGSIVRSLKSTQFVTLANQARTLHSAVLEAFRVESYQSGSSPQLAK